MFNTKSVPIYLLLTLCLNVDMTEPPSKKHKVDEPKVGGPRVGEFYEKSNPHLIFFMFSACLKDNVCQNNAL